MKVFTKNVFLKRAHLIKKLLLIFFSGILIPSCGIYSFTGASIPPEAKTVSVAYFQNNAEMVIPTLSQSLTEKMQDYFTSQTSLVYVPRAGDLQISGSIVGYSTKPMAIQANETAALNELTIQIEVEFINNFDDKQNFKTRFTQNEQYESSSSLATIEQEIVPVIVDKLVEAVFNKAVVNW